MIKKISIVVLVAIAVIFFILIGYYANHLNDRASFAGQSVILLFDINKTREINTKGSDLELLIGLHRNIKHLKETRKRNWPWTINFNKEVSISARAFDKVLGDFISGYEKWVQYLDTPKEKRREGLLAKALVDISEARDSLISATSKLDEALVSTERENHPHSYLSNVQALKVISLIDNLFGKDFEAYEKKKQEYYSSGGKLENFSGGPHEMLCAYVIKKTLSDALEHEKK